MAFTASGASGEFHYLAEVYLDGTTLRYADEDLSIRLWPTAGAFYEGRLPQSAVLVRDLGSFLEPKEVVSTYNMVIDNADSQVSPLLSTYTWANRPVRVYIGEGRDKANYSEIYRGNVAFPNGITRDQKSVQVTVVDSRLRYRKYIPPMETRFYDSTADSRPGTPYPKIELRNKAKPIPIVFGNWSSAAGSGASIPCICIDTNVTAAPYTPASEVKKFKIAGHRIKSIDKFLWNAVRLSYKTDLVSYASNGVSLSAGTFYLSGIPYNATTDTVAVNCKGLVTANVSLVEKPGETLRTLLTSYVGLSATDLNVTAFHTLDTTSDLSDYKLRRYLNGEESSETVIQELLNECACDMRFVRGKYSPKVRTLTQDSERLAFREDDIVVRSEDEEVGDYRVEYDPDRFYVNHLVVKYDYDPINDTYQGAVVARTQAEISDATAAVQRVMNFKWLHSSGGAIDRTIREISLYCVEPAVIETTFTRRATLLDLGDQIDLTYDSYNAYPFQVRHTELDLGNMTMKVRAYDLWANVLGKWTADSAPAWTIATVNGRKISGFFTDAAGLADPGDPYSARSTWY
jgi:hypothetical protein